MKWLTFIRKDFFQLFQKNLALIWKYVTKTDIAKSRVEENWNIALSQCLASTLRRWTVSYECVMVTGLMLACHHVTLHTVLWIPDTSYWPHGQHVTGFTITIFWGWTDPHRNTIWEMIKSSVLISFIVAVFMMLIWCPATQPGKPRQTCRAPVTGAELFIIELRNCRSGLNMWNSAGDWLVINIMGGNYVSPLR